MVVVWRGFFIISGFELDVWGYSVKFSRVEFDVGGVRFKVWGFLFFFWLIKFLGSWFEFG